MIIKIKGSTISKFETTKTRFKEITDEHPAIFTRKGVRNILKRIKDGAYLGIEFNIDITAKCGDCDLFHHYNISKTDKGNLQVGCSVIAKKDVQRLRKWANRK
jgi:hypothetical protein